MRAYPTLIFAWVAPTKFLGCVLSRTAFSMRTAKLMEVRKLKTDFKFDINFKDQLFGWGDENEILACHKQMCVAQYQQNRQKQQIQQ